MTFNILTLMPEFINQGLDWGVIGKARKKEIYKTNIISPREFTTDVHQSVDDRPYGGGDGMVMLIDPLEKTLASIEHTGPIYVLSPQGEVFNDSLAEEMAGQENLTFICGRYSGIDQRFLVRNNIKEISIGDYVISGGELGALVIIDSVLRKKPGVLGHEKSAAVDSFAQGAYLEAPQFTRPQDYEGLKVPEILMSGDHKKIEDYRIKMGLLITLQKRPKLLDEDSNTDWAQLKAFLNSMSDNELKVCGLDVKKIESRLRERLS